MMQAIIKRVRIWLWLRCKSVRPVYLVDEFGTKVCW